MFTNVAIVDVDVVYAVIDVVLDDDAADLELLEESRVSVDWLTRVLLRVQINYHVNVNN